MIDDGILSSNPKVRWILLLLPRNLARQFRAVLRRCATPADSRRDPFIVLRSSSKGLSVEAVLTETALRLDHPGKRADATLAFPASVLATLEGSTDDPVTLEELRPGQGRAAWNEAGTETSHDFNTVQPDGHLSFPAMPTRLTDPGTSFVSALAEVSETAARQITGRSVHCLLLRGNSGQVVATDGRQLLVQGGVRLPWREDVLVPRLDAWNSRDLSQTPASLGRTATHVIVRLGAWTFALTVEPRGRFPAFETVIPSPDAVTTRLHMSMDDVILLKKQLPRLPGAKEKPAPITLDVGKAIVVRARGDDGEESVLELEGAKADGQPIRVEMDRRYLLRAVKLGFHTVEIVRADRPLCCRKDVRVFVWMPLTEPARSAQPSPHPPPAPVVTEKEKPIMPEPNGKHSGSGDAGVPSATDPLAEAETLRNLLTEAQSRLARLIAALKQHRRQAKAVQAAVQSLRQLPPLTP